jgi:mono/diheme cytochrome c family protein
MRLNHFLLGAPLVLAALSGCTRDGKFQPVDMWNGSRLKPYENVNFFDDKRSSRTPPAGTVARGQDRLNEPLYYGTKNGILVATNPIFDSASPVDKVAILERGQERYQIYCQPCHGLAGYGDGMIVKRGFAKPPTYHQERLRKVTDGYIYDVITNGYGSMYSYGARVPPRDRWAIVAYIRALQRSQNAQASDVPAGINPNVETVVPQIQPGEQKYMGPGAGREYHGTGPGGRGEMGSNGANEEQGMNQTGQVRP